MKINLTPQRSENEISVIKAGDTLTINGEAFNFGTLAEGATLPRAACNCKFLASDVERADGEIALALILPYGPDATDAERFPNDIQGAQDGTIIAPSNGSEQSGAVVEGAIDWSKVVTAEAKAEQRATQRLVSIKGECRARIYAQASAETQMNMATAAAVASAKPEAARSADDVALLAGVTAALAWVASMRATVGTLAENPGADITADTSWPTIPPEAAAVAAMV